MKKELCLDYFLNNNGRKIFNLQGFENDATLIFKSLIDELKFLIERKSDHGVVLINGKIQLDIFHESGLQIWVKDIYLC